MSNYIHLECYVQKWLQYMDLIDIIEIHTRFCFSWKELKSSTASARRCAIYQGAHVLASVV